jgi:hypothetical protein
VPQDQQFGILAQVSPHQHSGQTEQTAHSWYNIDSNSIP